MTSESLTFPQRLRKKLRMDRLARQVLATLGSPDSGKKIDKDAMRELLAETDYKKVMSRDLELYVKDLTWGKKRILVLDNELPVYTETTVDDVLIYKSPTVKEMVHNFVKILYDKRGVVTSRRQDTVNAVHRQILDGLDLSFTQKDVEDLGRETAEALAAADAGSLVKDLTLFGALIGYNKAPADVFDAGSVEAMGKFSQSRAKTPVLGPCVFFVRAENRLGFVEKPVDLADKDKKAELLSVVAGSVKADAEGAKAVSVLVQEVVKAYGLAPGKRADLKEGKTMLIQ